MLWLTSALVIADRLEVSAKDTIMVWQHLTREIRIGDFMAYITLQKSVRDLDISYAVKETLCTSRMAGAICRCDPVL